MIRVLALAALVVIVIALARRPAPVPPLYREDDDGLQPSDERPVYLETFTRTYGVHSDSQAWYVASCGHAHPWGVPCGAPTWTDA